MFFTKVACAVALGSAVYATPTSVEERAAANGGTSLTLNQNAVQSGSFNNGGNEIGAEATQALSATSQNNFINQCSGKTLTNGLQITTGSCNGIPMGDIPAKTNMVSSTIINPPTGGKGIPSDTTFNITVQMANLVAGSFTNADSTYYAAPQALQGGIVVGHTHVVVQDLGKSLNPTTALDATQFAFFKGINDAGNGKGLLSAVVTGGLPAGNYRVCTMASSSNHQPVLMPVAQRGTPDDCTKFVVTGSGTTANAASNNGSGGIAAAAAAASAVAAGPNNTQAPTSAAAAAATSAAAGKGGKGAAASSAATAATSAAAAKGGNGKAAASSATSAAKAANTGAATGKAGVAGGQAKGGNNAAAAQGGNRGGNGGRFGRRARFMSREFIA